MKKKYYNCPIQALYMNKEFGVQFYISYKNDFSDKKLSFHVDIENIYNVLIQLLGIYNQKLSGYKIYVAPESEHIFEPKKGDLGIERNLHTLEPCFFGGTYWFYDNDYLEIKPHPQKVDIIYRNGKHFFNPKEEN